MDLIDRDMTILELEGFRDSCIAHLMRMSFEDITDVVKDIPAVNRWIPCSERLPEVDEDVLVFCDGVCMIGSMFSDGSWMIDGQFCYSKDDVTHWMSKPEPPK